MNVLLGHLVIELRLGTSWRRPVANRQRSDKVTGGARQRQCRYPRPQLEGITTEYPVTSDVFAQSHLVQRDDGGQRAPAERTTSTPRFTCTTAANARIEKAEDTQTYARHPSGATPQDQSACGTHRNTDG